MIKIRYRYIIIDRRDQTLRIIPADAGIGDGLSEDMILRLAVSLFDIGFYHKSLDETSELRRILSGVHDFLRDPQLLLVLFRRIAVVRIHHDGRIHEILLHIEIVQKLQILVVIVRNDLAVL